MRSAGGDSTERLSEFRWNSVLFESFQSGYLKKLDYRRVRELGVIARRVYRYLDKHFHPPHRTTLVLHLRTFACEHIGISRANDASQTKRLLQKAIGELESIHFLLADANRFRKVGREWEVTFTLAGHKPPRRVPSRLASVPSTSPSVVTAARQVDDSLDRYLKSVSATERRRIEMEALGSASGFLRETLESHHKSGPLVEECRRQIIRAFLLRSGMPI